MIEIDSSTGLILFNIRPGDIGQGKYLIVQYGNTGIEFQIVSKNAE